MMFLKKTFFVTALSIFLLSVFNVNAQEKVSARITAFDPQPGVTLSFYDKFYLQISYDSDIPLRFQTSSFRHGVKLDYGAMENSASLNSAGKGTALVWVSFSNPTRIDEISVDVLDTEWQKIDQLGINIDSVWGAPRKDEPRKPAAWVEKLIRKERIKQEFVFDPSPTKKETVFDLFFYLSAITIPFYLFLQIQFLRRWRVRWRELSFIPILSITPMIFLSIFGLGMEFRLWIIFIFRGIPLALIYLVVLWVVKQISERKVSSDG